MSRPARTPRKPKRQDVVSARPAEPRIEIAGGTVCLELPGAVAQEIVFLLDDALVATGSVGTDGTAAIQLPPGRIGGLLSVLSLPGAVPLLAPIDVAAGYEVELQEWGTDGLRVTGRFTVAGLPGRAPILVRHLGGLPTLTFAVDDGDGYRFEVPIPTLVPRAVPLELRLELGGRVMPGTLTVRDRDCGMLGHVDVSEAPLIQGWAIDLATPKRRVAVAVSIDGTEIWRGPASQVRPDLQAHGLGDGRSGFAVPFPKGLSRQETLTIAVTLLDTGTHLVGSPYTVAPPPPLVGYFDALEGPFAGGWAVNMWNPDRPLHVEAVCEGTVIGAGIAELFRGDVENAGMPTARCGFRFLLERPLPELFDRDIYLRVTGTDQMLGGSPRQISQNSNIVRFLTRGSTIPAPVQQRLVRRMAAETAGSTLSIVMPIYNTRRDWLVQSLTSVLAQWCPNWELICVDDGSREAHVGEILATAARHDSRVRVMRSPGNLGIARATNFGLRAARGDYVAFMDHDDTIEPDAVHKLLMAARRTDADLVYSDEAITTDDIDSIIEVRARPAFSHDYYMSHPYFVHMIAVRAEIARRLGGWDEQLAISADVDFVLRVIEAARVVTHVPSVLYRWRTHGGSAGHSKQATVTETMLDVLNRHLVRAKLPGTARAGMRYNEYRIDWPDDGGEVLIVIPTKNRVDLLKTCIDSIEATSKGANYRIVVIDHQSTDKKTVRYLKDIGGRHTVMPYSGIFNYALMNNLAVKTHGGRARYVLFLNNDVEAREDGWLSRMRSLAGRPDVGAVGPLLLYGDDRIQHAGVLMAFSGAADHAMKFQDAYLGGGGRHPGYNCNLTSVRDYSAVTAACVMIRMDVFKKVRGFDEEFVVGFNDTDLCLRIVAAGFKVLYDGFTVLYHHESATRTESKSVDHPEDDARLRARWGRYFREGDPFYSPLLAPRGTDHTLRQDDGCKGRTGVRAVRVGQPAGHGSPLPARNVSRADRARKAAYSL